MKTIDTKPFEVVDVEFVPSNLEQGKVYVSSAGKCAVHLCMCGCGQKTVMPLTPSGWQIEWHPNGTASFSPSVGNYQFPCNSHYMLQKNIAKFLQ